MSITDDDRLYNILERISQTARNLIRISNVCSVQSITVLKKAMMIKYVVERRR